MGFVHGVMNTDNMSILGLTIDYGPYGWLDSYGPDWTPNTTDLPGRRYRFGHQPLIAQWNLLKLANALYPLTGNEERLRQTIENFRVHFTGRYTMMMKSKIGLYLDEDGDDSLVFNLEQLLKSRETDMTIFFRLLSEVTSGMTPEDMLDILEPAFYSDGDTSGYTERFARWSAAYLERLRLEKAAPSERKKMMNLTNPKYVLRNYMAQMAIEASERGDHSVLSELQDLLRNPYDDRPEMEKWSARRPDWARQKVGCSMLSCSS